MEHIPSGTETTPEHGWQRRPLEDGLALRHILLVEGHENLAWALKDGLESLPGCSVAVAHRGEQAIKLLQSRPFDLLIAKYQVPGMDGITLAEKVRQLYPEMAIIMLTTYASDRLYEQAARMSIRCVLEQPVPLADIRSAAVGAMESPCQALDAHCGSSWGR